VVAGISSENVFKVPGGYFESFSGSILLQLNAGDLQQTGTHPFSVPQGYFDNLACSILSRIKTEQASEVGEAIPEFLAGIGNKNIFSIPQDYFENLPENIVSRLMTKDTVAEETSDISKLVEGIGRRNVYSVPQGYFENLSEKIISGNIKSSEIFSETNAISALVAGIGSKNIFNVPQEYFNHLSENIFALASGKNEVTSEVSEISTLVAGIGNKNVYSIPQGYFENLAGHIHQKKETATAAKVVTMKSRAGSFKYAAAAAVTGIIGLSLFFMLNKPGSIKGDAETLAAVKAGTEILKQNSFDKEMNSISDDAIVSFLESKGENVEAALVASLADEKNLPDATDYLINDNTLDEVLKTIDLTN
jgi:hypothetical protein